MSRPRVQLIDHDPATLTISIRLDQPRQRTYEVHLNKFGCSDKEANNLAAAVLAAAHRDLPRCIAELRQETP